MSQIVIKMLRVPPLLYVGTGIWLYSNQQVFEDRVLPMTDSALMMNSGHNFQQLFTEVTPGTVFLIYPCVLILHHGYKWFKHRYLKRSMKKELKDGIVCQDDLPNFFAALPMDSRLALIREEVQNMQRHHFSKLSKEALYELVS